MGTGIVRTAVGERPVRLPAHAEPGFAVPAGACDCHVHVFGPAARYPYASDRRYTPADASIEDLSAMHAGLHIARAVIVQPSVYGSDNACTVDAVRRLGRRARGVAVIDRRMSDADLSRMHAAGIRGVRLNLETSGIADAGFAARELAWAASRVARLGWHVQIHAGLAVLAALDSAIAALPVPLVVDHFGRIRAGLGPGLPELAPLLALMRAGKVYVKLSAPYRISERSDYADVRAIARAMIEANPERVVWGSDWPHVSAGRPAATVAPFRPEDDGLALRRLAAWTQSRAELEAILVGNPARLYGFGDAE